MSKALKKLSDQYLGLLTTELSGINLTRINNSDEFYEKQIIDSVIPFSLSSKFENLVFKSDATLVDVGFGGGFPLVPIAFSSPNSNCIGLESKNKKVKAVELISEKLGVKNIKLFHQRIESVMIDIPALITFKAVGEIKDLLSKINACHKEVYVYFYKGPKLNEKEDLSLLPENWKQIEDISYELPTFGARRLIGYKIKNVPRGTTNKSLVKLSELAVSY
ncbi:MAG: hypothetical protein HOJ35_11025 [Bdellovibrionales bacterium]|jgi:16S rRNA (guanine527-N7)-methyltransferase|nr:hypothetical protein [Bdellovibrionales bacterium]